MVLELVNKISHVLINIYILNQICFKFSSIPPLKLDLVFEPKKITHITILQGPLLALRSMMIRNNKKFDWIKIVNII